MVVHLQNLSTIFCGAGYFWFLIQSLTFTALLVVNPGVMKNTSLVHILLCIAVALPAQITPPSCVITFPHNNAYFQAGSDIPVRVYASTLGGTRPGNAVTRVEFFRDTVKLGEAEADTANTYYLTWSDTQSGEFRLTARATVDDSVSFTSAGVQITVGSMAAEPTGMAPSLGKYLGNIIAYNVRPDFNQYWNAVTSENACKWGSVEGTRDVMNWNFADVAYNHARDHHMVFRYHVLAWGSQYPSWIEGLEPAEFREEVEEYIAAAAERYPFTDQVEVLNEAMHIHTYNGEEHAAGTPYFREGLGGPGETGYDWAIWLFRKARQYFPDSKLVINDFELETNTAGRNEILDMVKVLRDSGLIDGFGTQAHYFNVDGINKNTLQNALNGMARSGLPIYVTELDMKGSPQTEAGQLASYQNAFPVYWNHPAVAGITLWGYVEGSTWATGTGILNGDGSERAAMEWLASYVAGTPLGAGQVNSPAAHGLHVFPNPASGTLNISGTEAEEMRVYDSSGREVMRLKPDRDELVLDVSHLSEGMYFIITPQAAVRFIRN